MTAGTSIRRRYHARVPTQTVPHVLHQVVLVDSWIALTVEVSDKCPYVEAIRIFFPTFLDFGAAYPMRPMLV